MKLQVVFLTNPDKRSSIHHFDMTFPCLSVETDVPIVTFFLLYGNIKFYSPASESTVFHFNLIL